LELYKKYGFKKALEECFSKMKGDQLWE
jgi:hypothetical protein